MKRSWIGFSLLLILLVVSLIVTGFMTRIHESIELDLRQAGRCALDRDWESAELFQRRALRTWRKWAHLRACFADHNPVEDIDADFAALEVYLQTRETISYSALSSALSSQVAAVGEAHEPVWWNLF